MLESIALILILGFLFGWVCQRLHIPSLFGMILAGILMGPFGLNLLDTGILQISSEIRKIALIIILTKAGLSLDLKPLKERGREAVLMCFIPATIEIIGIVIFGPKLLGISLLEAALLGSVLGAVSPAVVVPRMVKLIEEGYGRKKGISELILAAASVDDVYVIVLFTTFLAMFEGKKASFIQFVNIPFSVFFGILIGLGLGWCLVLFLEKMKVRVLVQVLMILSISFLIVWLESKIKFSITFSALIAVMFLGVGIRKKHLAMADRLSSQFGKLWMGAEVFLFVLVGAIVNISYIGKVGMIGILLILIGLIFRMCGVYLSLFNSKLNKKERLFTMIAYTPKATVQAAIGGIPLSLGLGCGDIILSMAVLAIMLTAPIGALLMDVTYQRLLEKS